MIFKDIKSKDKRMSHANFKSQLINPLEKNPRLWDKK